MLLRTENKESVGRGHYHQNRLFLCTVKELHAAFNPKYLCTEVGLLDFFEFKPKWWVALGLSGTHGVCVCSICEKIVLLADAFNISYRETVPVMVCNTNNKRCMVHCCVIVLVK